MYTNSVLATSYSNFISFKSHVMLTFIIFINSYPLSAMQSTSVFRLYNSFSNAYSRISNFRIILNKEN